MMIGNQKNWGTEVAPGIYMSTGMARERGAMLSGVEQQSVLDRLHDTYVQNNPDNAAGTSSTEGKKVQFDTANVKEVEGREEEASMVDLRELYEQIEEIEEVVNRLVDSNAQLQEFLTEAEGGDDDSDADSEDAADGEHMEDDNNFGGVVADEHT